MSLGWQSFRVICFFQMLGAIFFAFVSLINLFSESRGGFLLTCLAYVLVAWLAILGINLLNNNYPDRPVSGTQKTVFNWVFLLNFILLAFLFGFIFLEYRQLKILAVWVRRPVFQLPFRLLIMLYINFLVLIFQLIILYGLYTLRRELYQNFFRNKQFEFENEPVQH
jgi:hypothetical protein